MLPERSSERRKVDRPEPDGRYADEAITLLLNKMDVVGAPHKEYQVKLFGGGNMFPESNEVKMLQIGIRNVQAARRLVNLHGFTCVAEHLGDTGHRSVIFKVWSGDVWVRHSNVLPITDIEPINRR
jgi:chemotaxis protein CheD